MKTVFEFREYKAFLHQALDGLGRGSRSQLADALKCDTAYISRVLKGGADLSLEQAESCASFLGLTSEEVHYFLLLVQEARSGTTPLKKYFRAQMDRIHQERLDLKNRLSFKKALGTEDQAIYYSTWIYAAVHVLVAVPQFQSKEALARALDLPLSKIAEVVEFLLRLGLVTQKGGKLGPGETSIHLGSDSPMIYRHHSNWRLQAMNSMEQGALEDLHYSSVVSLSADDVPKSRAILVRAIEEIRSVVRSSGDETALCYCIDLFSLV